MLLHPKQKEIALSKSRFKVIRAGRKAGKTSQEVEVIAYKATASVKKLTYLTKSKFATGRKVLYIAPTQLQARNIIWGALKNRLAGIGKPNEQLMQMSVPTEDGDTSIIYVGGWENRENYRGLTDVIHISFDEVDTLKGFFVTWFEVFRPMFLDTGGSADFIGTPKKENPNLRRLEVEFAEQQDDFASFKFTSLDNPYLALTELDSLKRAYKNDMVAYRQEILAEYVENEGALFKYTALLDIFSNAVPKTGEKYLVVDVADDGSDDTIFNYWNDLESYKIERYRLPTDGIINEIRQNTIGERIPLSHVAVDAIGVGAGVASSPLLAGIIGYKSSYSAIKGERSIVALPNVHYIKEPPLVSDFSNLRSQCVFTLAQMVNDHKIACTVQDATIKSHIIEELSTYQDVSKGDGKRTATHKEDIHAVLGRSPDITDTFLMRMYFVLRENILPGQTERTRMVESGLSRQFDRNTARMRFNSTK